MVLRAHTGCLRSVLNMGSTLLLEFFLECYINWFADTMECKFSSVLCLSIQRTSLGEVDTAPWNRETRIE